MMSRPPILTKLSFLIGVLMIPLTALAGGSPRPDNVFSDHMVLQCDLPVPIWGRGQPNENLVVMFGDQRQRTQADNQGNWRIVFEPMKASSKPQTLLVSSLEDNRGEFELKDVLIGEVWYCVGQSNMFVRLRPDGVTDAQRHIASADMPAIRMCFNLKPWEVITPKTVTGHSAVSYFAAKELHEKLKVPVGIVTIASGGRALQTFFELERFNSDPANADIVAHWDKASEHDERELGYRAFLKPGGMALFLEPYYGYGFRGVFWYQGESEAARNWSDRTVRLYPQLIERWREIWGRASMPFYSVQLPSYGKVESNPGADSSWASVRDAMTVDLPETGFAVTYDIDNTDLHPKAKEEVGKRLARVALELTYKQPVAGRSPQIAKAVRNGSDVVVSFEHLSGGLKATDGSLEGFALQNNDGNWHWARARISGKNVLVSCEGIPTPIKLRYAWADHPNANLETDQGVPVAPYQGPVQ